jgi:hypothetical protein
MSDPNDEDSVLRLVEDVAAQNLALQTICGALMAQIAMLDKSPEDRLAEITSGLRGTIHGLVGKAGTDRTTMMLSQTVEKVCEVGEILLSGALARRLGG